LRRERRPISRLVRAIVVLAFLCVIPLAIEYARQVGLKRRWIEAELELQARATQVWAEHATLEACKAYVQTDQYVERAAREKLKMARPGEVVVVVVGTRESVPLQSTVQATPAPTEGSWWKSLFQ